MSAAGEGWPSPKCQVLGHPAHGASAPCWKSQESAGSGLGSFLRGNPEMRNPGTFGKTGLIAQNYLEGLAIGTLLM